jgi:hypothetical protein
MTITFRHWAEPQVARGTTWPSALGPRQTAVARDPLDDRDSQASLPDRCRVRDLCRPCCRDDRAPAGDLAPPLLSPLNECPESKATIHHEGEVS